MLSKIQNDEYEVRELLSPKKKKVQELLGHALRAILCDISVIMQFIKYLSPQGGAKILIKGVKI